MHLSEPVPWSQRETLPDCSGVYVLAKGDEIVFVGATSWDQGVRSQIESFHASATTGEGSHAGGIAYSERYGNDVGDLTIKMHLPYAINSDAEVLDLYARYACQRFLWEQFEQTGKVPVCNAES